MYFYFYYFYYNDDITTTNDDKCTVTSQTPCTMRRENGGWKKTSQFTKTAGNTLHYLFHLNPFSFRNCAPDRPSSHTTKPTERSLKSTPLHHHNDQRQNLSTSWNKPHNPVSHWIVEHPDLREVWHYPGHSCQNGYISLVRYCHGGEEGQRD